MATELYANYMAITLGAAVTTTPAAGTSENTWSFTFPATPTGGITPPAPGTTVGQYRLLVDNENVIWTGGPAIPAAGGTTTGNVVTRGAEGTVPATHLINAAVAFDLTTGSLSNTVQLTPSAAQTGAINVTGGITSGGAIQGTTLTSTVATGTPPFAVTSATLVANLNAAQVGNLSASSLVQLSPAAAQTGNINIGTGTIASGAITSSGAVQGTTLTSTIATGTAPFTVTSTTQVANLNAATAGSATSVGGFAALSSNTSPNYVPLLIENVYAFTTATTAGTITLPDVTSDTIIYMTLAAGQTLAFPPALAGKSFVLVSSQNATGGYSITWPTNIKWTAGVAPTQSTGVSKTDTYSFICVDGTNWLGYVTASNF